MQLTDNELLTRFVEEGDEIAFEQLVRRHSNTVWRVCQGLMWHQQDAEDVFQATFFLLSTKAKKLIKHRSLGGWLHVVAVRTCLKHRRLITRSRETSLREEIHCRDSEPWQEIAAARDRETLYREIAELPSAYREVIVLSCLDGKSRKEVAQLLQRSSASVKAALSRGKKLLRRRLLQCGLGCSLAVTSVTSSAVAAANPLSPIHASISEPLIQSTLQSCFSSNPGIVGSILPQLSNAKPNLFGVNLGTAKTSVLVTSMIVVALLGWCSTTSFSDQQNPWIVIDHQQTNLVTREVHVSYPQADAEDQEAQELEDNFRSSQQSLMERELALIKNQIEIDDFLVHEIRETLRGDLIQAVKRFRESKQGQGSDFVFGPCFDEQLEMDTWNQVRAAIPAEKNDDFEIFVASARRRNQMRSQHYRRLTVQTLSNLLSLSLEQKFEVEALVSHRWKREWNIQASLSRAGAGFSDIISESLKDQLQRVLTRKQFETFQQANEFLEIPMFDMVVDPDAEGWNTNLLKDKCGTLMELRITQLDQLCKLTPDQLRKIRVAKNGAIMKTVADWESVRQSLHDESVDKPADPLMRANLLVPLITPCLTVQCTSQREWQNTIQNVLDDAQLARWENRDQIRKEATRDLMIGQFVNSLEGYSVGFTYAQHQKMTLLLKNHIDRVRTGSRLELAFHLSQIPDEKFAEILDEYQLSKILPTIRLRREPARFFSDE